MVFGINAIRLPRGDDEAIQHVSAVHADAGEHVVSIVANNLSWRLSNVVPVGIAIVAINITAQDGGVALPVALVKAGLRPGKAAVKRHAAFESEGIFPGRTRNVQTFHDPNFLSAGASSQSRLQGAGVCPSGTVTAALRGRRGIQIFMGFVSAHIHNGRRAPAGVGVAGDIHKARVALQVRGDA